jgi:hypothetical protein
MSIQNCALRFDHYGVTARMIQAVLSIAPPDGPDRAPGAAV